MSPEARPAPGPAFTTRAAWRDALIGGLLAVPVALIIATVDRDAYRAGAAGVAFVVVVGLALRWTVALGAAAAVLVGVGAQVTSEFTRWPGGANLTGGAVLAGSLSVVVVALRRWEGDRRRAREESQARLRNERRLQALVDLAHHLAAVAGHRDLFEAVRRQVPLAAGCTGVILVVGDRDRTQVAVVGGHRSWRSWAGRSRAAAPRDRRHPHRRARVLCVGGRGPRAIPETRRARRSEPSTGLGCTPGAGSRRVGPDVA